MGGRSFAGYAYRDSLGVGFFGELFAATGTGGRDARVLHLARRLAGRSGYPEALARFGSDLAGLEHPSLIPTLTVGRDLDRTVVVVTGGALGAVSVEQISGAQRGQRVPVSVALGVAVSATAGVAAAHARGIVHGALHPRSLLIDAAGKVMVDHFAPARALASLAATSDDADLLDGFRGYLAPELALAEEPTPASDVYSLGAILYFLFGGDVTGEAQPGRIAATTTVRRTIARALDTDATRRFPSALELLAELQRAVEVDRLQLAAPVDLALYSDDAREAAGLPVGVPAEPARAVSGGLDALLDELGDGPEAEPEEPSDEEPTAIAPPQRRAGSAVPEVDDVLASLDGELSDRVDIGTLAEELAAETGSDDDLAIADGELTMPSAVARLRDDPDTAVAPMVDEETGDHSQLTQVDDLEMGPDRDPILGVDRARARRGGRGRDRAGHRQRAPGHAARLGRRRGPHAAAAAAGARVGLVHPQRPRNRARQGCQDGRSSRLRRNRVARRSARCAARRPGATNSPRPLGADRADRARVRPARRACPTGCT